MSRECRICNIGLAVKERALHFRHPVALSAFGCRICSTRSLRAQPLLHFRHPAALKWRNMRPQPFLDSAPRKPNNRSASGAPSASKPTFAPLPRRGSGQTRGLQQFSALKRADKRCKQRVCRDSRETGGWKVCQTHAVRRRCHCAKASTETAARGGSMRSRPHRPTAATSPARTGALAALSRAHTALPHRPAAAPLPRAGRARQATARRT